jgi:hypothetical protein
LENALVAVILKMINKLVNHKMQIKRKIRVYTIIFCLYEIELNAESYMVRMRVYMECHTRVGHQHVLKTLFNQMVIYRKQISHSQYSNDKHTYYNFLGYLVFMQLATW